MYVYVGGMDVRLNSELFEKVDYFTYFGSQVAADGACENNILNNEWGHEVWGELTSAQRNTGLRINAKKCPYEGVIVPMALNGAETWV